MNKIIYREIRNGDYEEIKVIINESFGLYKYIEDPKVLKTVLKVYLQSCLAEKTFSCVAEKDNKVIGVILGNAKSDYSVLKHLKPIVMMGWYSLVMWAFMIAKVLSETESKVCRLQRKVNKLIWMCIYTNTW